MGDYTSQGLYKPTQGETGWDDEVNSNFDLLDPTLEFIAGGLVSTTAYTDTAGVVLDDCEDTTNWVAVNTYSGSVETNSTYKTTGTNSVRALLKVDTSGISSLYVNLAAPVSTNGANWVYMDLTWSDSVSFGGVPPLSAFRPTVADAVDLGGTTAQYVIHPDTSYTMVDEPEAAGTFVTVKVNVAGLTTIRSVGITRPSATGAAGRRGYFYIDNIRLAAITAADKALNSASAAAVMISPNYSESQTQDSVPGGATKAIIDPRPNTAVFPGSMAVRNLREWRLDETGTTDVSLEMQAIFDSLPANTKLVAPSTAVYLKNAQVEIPASMRGSILDFQGAAIIQSLRTNQRNFIVNADDITVRNLRIHGYRTSTVNGSLMGTVAGTPTVNGTTIELNAQNEEVRVNEANMIYGRDHLLRNRWDFVLSDSSHTASDCVISIKDEFGNVLQTTTLTLTGTPTVNTVYYSPVDLSAELVATVKKSTATANTITVTSYTNYGKGEYNSNFPFNHGFVPQRSNFLVENCLFEGLSGDSLSWNTPGQSHITVRNCMVRANGRQSISPCGGTDVLIENCILWGSGRHGIDIEPETVLVDVHDVVIRNCRVGYTALGAYVSEAFGRAYNVTIEDCIFEESSPKIMFWGGFTGGRVRNLTMRLNDPSAATDEGIRSTITARDVVFENITSDVGIEINPGTSTGPDGVVTAGSLSVRGLRFTRALRDPLEVTAPDVELHDIEVRSATDSFDTAHGFHPVAVSADTMVTGFDHAILRAGLPNSFKGVASPSLWFPRGLDLHNETLLGVHGLSGGTARANNLRGIAQTLGNGVSYVDITFPTQTFYNAGNFDMVGQAGGTLSTGTTYYYRVAVRNVYGGPSVAVGEKSIATGTNTQVRIRLTASAFNSAGGLAAGGVTIWRGTSPGTYDTRYDVMPSMAMYGISNMAITDGNNFYITDRGSEVTDPLGDFVGFTFPVAAQTPGPFTVANETGWEPDTNYGVFVETTWNAGYCWITNRARSGFRINFATVTPDANQTCSWLLAR